VRRAFRKLGHAAFSCDLLPAMDNSVYHFKGDIFILLKTHPKWDLLIAHPPCTHLAVSGARWFPKKQADGRQRQGIDFFMRFTKTRIPKVAIENPVSIMSTHWRKPDQIIQPWQFGHGEVKATCLWLEGLPKLVPTDIVEGRQPRVHHEPPSKDRWMKRSETLQGIADAMAAQWGGE
jgi:site-specific DNA-cytosine methylase